MYFEIRNALHYTWIFFSLRFNYALDYAWFFFIKSYLQT